MSTNVRRWSPTGESQVFVKASDVPPGWTDFHPGDTAVTAAAKVVQAAAGGKLTMSRDEIVAALVEGGIAFKQNGGTKALHDLLRASLVTALTEAGKVFAENADTKDLYALLTAPPAE